MDWQHIVFFVILGCSLINTQLCTIEANCNDNNPCTVDKCNMSVCVHTSLCVDNKIFCDGKPVCILCVLLVNTSMRCVLKELAGW